MSAISEEVRKSFKEGDDIRDRGLTTPKDVERFDNLSYGSEKKWQILDVYRPKKEKGKTLPVIVSVHGGAWVYGDKDRYQYYCMGLAQRGFAVVNFTYHLAPEFQFPASLEDTNLVFRWVLDHAPEYGFDTDRIFAVGDSAGAHILSLYCCMCTNPEYAENYPFAVPRGFVPKAVALNCGVYHIEVRKDVPEDLTTLLMGDFLPEKGSKRELDLISAAEHVNGAFPPSYVMTCDGDFLKYQAPVLIRRLLDQNIPFRFGYYRSSAITLGHVFQLNLKLPEAAQCTDEECRFFQKVSQVPENRS